MVECPICGNKKIQKVLEASFFNTDVLQCSNCKFGFNDQTNIDFKNLDQYYKGEYWSKFMKKKTFIQKLDSELSQIHRAKSQFDYIKSFGNNVLDIGSGKGKSSVYAKKQGCAVTVIEPDIKNCERIKHKINIINTTFEEYIESNNTKKFDIIRTSHVLEHVKDPLKFTMQIKKLLNPNGVIFHEIPNCTSLKRLELSIKEPHFSYFTRKSLENLANKTNLKIIKLESFTTNLPSNFKRKLFYSCLGHKPFRIAKNDTDGIFFRIIMKC